MFWLTCLALGLVLAGCAHVTEAPLVDISKFAVPDNRLELVRVDGDPYLPWVPSQQVWVSNLNGGIRIYPISPPAGGTNWLGAVSSNVNQILNPGNVALGATLLAK